MDGKVYLVGAGPGDPELITVKGIRAIKEADVILYDRLANDSLLEKASSNAELIYVGKKAANHYKTQQEINQLLVDKAVAGNTVTRLKGGDPFVFGRGGEEAEFLNNNGMDFEIIPGITSPIAVPAYAGIPVTNRNISSSVGFVTGHESPDKEESSVDWNKLANGVETLVILMGVGNLPNIVPQLLEAGKSEDTPVALIRWGTRVNQQTLTGCLGNIVQKVQEANFKPPAIIIVGEVVKLREKLNWFERKPLFGKDIVVTRPVKQADSFCHLLRQEGANPIKLPAIKILPPEDYTQLDNKIKSLNKYDWCIFTSVNGVTQFMKRVFANDLDVRVFADIKLCAIGSKTAAELRKYGLVVDFVPEDYVSESILDGFKEYEIKGKRFLLPRANIAREKLKTGLKAQGAEVDNIIAYRTQKALRDEYKKRLEDLKQDQVDIVTFTSSSTVDNFITALGDRADQWMKKLRIACIGPITASTVEKYGYNVDIIAKEYTIEGLMEAIKNHYK